MNRNDAWWWKSKKKIVDDDVKDLRWNKEQQRWQDNGLLLGSEEHSIYDDIILRDNNLRNNGGREATCKANEAPKKASFLKTNCIDFWGHNFMAVHCAVNSQSVLLYRLFVVFRLFDDRESRYVGRFYSRSLLKQLFRLLLSTSSNHLLIPKGMRYLLQLMILVACDMPQINWLCRLFW